VKKLLVVVDEQVAAVAVWREAAALIYRHPVAAFLPAVFVGILAEAPYLLPDSEYVVQDILAFLTEAFAFYLYVAYVEQVIVEAQSAQHIPLRSVLGYLLLAAPLVPLVMAGSAAAITLPTAAASVLVIPGLWLLTRWSLFAPVIVREGLGPVAALRRSSELVRGHFEVVFLTAAFAVIVEEAVTDVGALVGLVVSGSDTWGEWVGGTVADILILPLASFATALVYGLLSRHS
jgi:phosphate starvation-inducible membrane PsiE